MSEAHSPLIKTWQQLVTVVVAAFVVPIVVILLVASLVTSGRKGGSATDESAVLARIQPVGSVMLAAGPRAAMSGEQVYAQVCKTCHETGLAGAPRFGDKAAWASVVAQGEKLTVQHAIAGFQGKRGVMPPKGGNPDLSDDEVHAAVVHMVNAAGANWKMPAPQAPAAAQASTAPAAKGPATPAPAAAAAVPTIPPPAPAAAAKPDGKKIYDTACMACHGTGVAGAPKLGDKAAWSARIAQGTDVLHGHAINGFQGKTGVMPPKGGNAALSDADVKAAVDYMVSSVK